METHVLSNLLGRNAVDDMKKVDTLYKHVLQDYVTGVGKNARGNEHVPGLLDHDNTFSINGKDVWFNNSDKLGPMNVRSRINRGKFTCPENKELIEIDGRGLCVVDATNPGDNSVFDVPFNIFISKPEFSKRLKLYNDQFLEMKLSENIVKGLKIVFDKVKNVQDIRNLQVSVHDALNSTKNPVRLFKNLHGLLNRPELTPSKLYKLENLPLLGSDVKHLLEKFKENGTLKVMQQIMKQLQRYDELSGLNLILHDIQLDVDLPLVKTVAMHILLMYLILNHFYQLQLKI